MDPAASRHSDEGWKNAAEVRVGKREVRVTNLEKVFFPEVGLTKGDLIAYFVA
jgi:bifunctional non-homologous end joining protein LigD